MQWGPPTAALWVMQWVPTTLWEPATRWAQTTLRVIKIRGPAASIGWPASVPIPKFVASDIGLIRISESKGH